MSLKDPHTQITFEVPGMKGEPPTVTFSGVPSEKIKRPEQILKLMDLLELPDGTNAQILFTSRDSVVR